MDWVHCNMCYSRPSQGKSFFLTSCGHLFCGGCNEKGNKKYCFVCKNTCNVIALSSKMSGEIQDYFSEHLTVLKKQIKVLEFQKNHREKMVKYFFDIESKYQEMQRLVKEMERKQQLLQEENMQLKMMLNNRSGGSSSSQRSGRTTPIGQAAVMGSTPSPKEMRSLQTPSPSGQRMTTPNSGQKGKKEWQPFHPPSGPNRLLVRPPPCNGKIISPKGLHNAATPGSTAVLLGPHVGSMDGHGTSPMSLSPVLTQPQRPLLSSNSYITPIPTRGTGPGAVPQSLPGRIQKQRQSPQPMTGVQHGPPNSYMIPSAMDQQSNLTQSQGRRFISVPNYASANVTTVPATGWRQGAPSSVPPRIITLSRQKTT